MKKKNRPQDFSRINSFRFLPKKKRTHSYSGMALLYLRKIDYFIRNVYFHRIFFFILKGIYNAPANHTQVNRQASVARI